MKYVDEFRDPRLIRLAAEEIRTLADSRRHYRIMEVCGGHTHAIFRFGLKDLLPPNVELIHGPGCPVCVLPMGRMDDGLDLANDPNVIFTAFGDMMRVPGSKGSPLESKARGADVRIVYSPLDALKIAQKNPDRKVVFFAIGFETTAPSTALTLLRARALGVTNFDVFCNHVTIIPAIRAILDSPDMRLDGFIGPGHVSTVIGCRPYEFIVRDYRCPIAVSGFEPLDILQSLVMVLRQLRNGEAKVENQYQPRRALGRQSAGAAGAGGSVRNSSLLRMARARIHYAVGLAHPRSLRSLGCRANDADPRHLGGRSKGRPVRRSAQRRAEAAPVQTVRQGMHAGTSDRRADGLQRRSVRGPFQIRPFRASCIGRALKKGTGSERPAISLSLDGRGLG